LERRDVGMSLVQYAREQISSVRLQQHNPIVPALTFAAWFQRQYLLRQWPDRLLCICLVLRYLGSSRSRSGRGTDAMVSFCSGLG
jgi:hypothetical protein